MYEKLTTSKKVNVMRRLLNLKISKGASITNHLNELNSTLTQLSYVAINFDNEIQVFILLSSLLKRLNSIEMMINNSS